VSIRDIISVVGGDWDSVVGLMNKALGTDISLLNTTNSNILHNGGKMMRPLLLMLSARACGGSNNDTLNYAAAIEMMHNATLLHDDVADQSAERRGIPTVNALLGPQAAVLVGDFWLARSVSLVLSCRNGHNMLGYFSKTLNDLAEGEMLQLEKSETADTTLQDYLRIIYCKTASLFESSAFLGAESVQACDSYKRAVGEYARLSGIAFQIKDDILDYAGDERLGKPVGIDLEEHKITLPLLCALENDPAEKDIRAKVSQITTNPSNADEVRSFVLTKNGTEKAAEKLEEYINLAFEALAPLPDSQAKRCLVELARLNAFRVK